MSLMPVVVSSGASYPNGMIVTDKAGQDISGCGFRTALADADASHPEDAAWATATPTFSHGPGSTVDNVATVEIICNGTNMVAGHDYRQWVELTDSGSVYVLPCPEILHAT